MESELISQSDIVTETVLRTCNIGRCTGSYMFLHCMTYDQIYAGLLTYSSKGRSVLGLAYSQLASAFLLALNLVFSCENLLLSFKSLVNS